MRQKRVFAAALACLCAFCAVVPARAETDKDYLYLLYSLNLAQSKCNLPVSAAQQEQIRSAAAGFEKKLLMGPEQTREALQQVSDAMDEAIKPDPTAACKEMNALLGFALKNIPKPK